MDDPDSKDPYQLAAFFDDMSDEQVVTILNTLDASRFANYFYHLKRKNHLLRLKRLVKSEKQQKLLEMLLDEQDKAE